MTTVQLGDTFIAATATTTVERFPIPAGGRLVHVSMAVGTSGGPVLASASLRSGAHGNSILHGWLRSSSLSEAFHSLAWDGEIGIPERQPAIVVRVRNDTGNENTMSVNILVES